MSSEISIYLPGDRFINMKVDEKGRINVAGGTDPRLSGEELSFLFILKEALACLSSGKSIDLHFNPFDYSEDETIIMKCQWQRGGTLHVLQDSGANKWQHATTVQEALDRTRNFTCTRALYKRLPRKRSG